MCNFKIALVNRICCKCCACQAACIEMVSICGKVCISDGECLTELHRYLNSTMVRNAGFAAAIKPPIFYEVARTVYTG